MFKKQEGIQYIPTTQIKQRIWIDFEFEFEFEFDWI